MWWPAPKDYQQQNPSKRFPRDIAWASAISALFVAHIYFIIIKVCPYWSICFPCTPLAPYAWPLVAIGLAMRLIWLATKAQSAPRRRPIRYGLAILLLLFATDTLTGGDYRWFELAMREQLKKCGGPEALQAWALGHLSTAKPPEEYDDKELDFAEMPTPIRNFASGYHWATYNFIQQDRDQPFKYISHDGTPSYDTREPAIVFDDGGWDMGWGIVVGKPDLDNGSPMNTTDPKKRGWTKRLKPGLFIYAFGG